MIHLLALLLGFFMDLIFGDPHWLPHPVRFIGMLISKGEKIIRPLFPATDRGELRAGVVLGLVVMAISTAIPYAILFIAGSISIYLQLAIETVMCYQIFATKSLKKESMKVYKQLKKGDLEASRKAVSMIVGRDTQSLDEEGVAKAAIETVAENTSDGIVAPALFMAIGGAPLGFFYKSINTMDSMIGYKNEKYLYFGCFAAKLDDLVNYIPARLSAYFMIAASFFLGMDYKRAAQVYKRDKYNHASPNSAHTEAVCAGALQIQLAGDAYYFGKLHKKPTIGDAVRKIVYEDIYLSNKLMYGTAILSVMIFSFGKMLFL